MCASVWQTYQAPDLVYESFIPSSVTRNAIKKKKKSEEKKRLGIARLNDFSKLYGKFVGDSGTEFISLESPDNPQNSLIQRQASRKDS